MSSFHKALVIHPCAYIISLQKNNAHFFKMSNLSKGEFYKINILKAQKPAITRHSKIK